MRILHYALGFPPFRRGGMTKYCVDLMVAEAGIGHDVLMLWPGTYWGKNDKVAFRGRNPFHQDGQSIGSIELVNPLPVPLLNGISNIPAYTQRKSTNEIKRFLSDSKIDVVHVHTLMGLPCELVLACADLGIPCVFTTHDYFGICPHWMLYRSGDVCTDDHDCRFCSGCCRGSLSIWKIRLLQSGLYARVKEASAVRLLRGRENALVNKRVAEDVPEGSPEDGERYKALRDFYLKMLNGFSTIHYNSTGTRDVYQRYLVDGARGEVISITNAEITDQRKRRSLHNAVRLGYCGPADVHKGFDLLIESCDRVFEDSGREFELHLFNHSPIEREYVVQHGPYQYVDLPHVMDQIDMLVVPSIYYETFGFTALEAISYGIPILLTDRVGARDLIVSGGGGSVSKPDPKSLSAEIRRLISSPNLLEEMNAEICDGVAPKSIQVHAKEIVQLYCS